MHAVRPCTFVLHMRQNDSIHDHSSVGLDARPIVSRPRASVQCRSSGIAALAYLTQLALTLSHSVAPSRASQRS